MTSASERRGFSVHIFLPDGDPAGVKIIEKSNWTGTGLLIPRTLFAQAKKRPELDRAGVYVLVGESETGTLPMVYIGEGDPVRNRVEKHGRAKDFWTHAVIFTGKDQNLNKAHVQRLESRLVELATRSKRCVLDNGNVPQPPSLSDADTAEVEGFLDEMLLCFPMLGYSFFEQASDQTHLDAPTFFFRRRGTVASGAESPQGFVVRAGSRAAKGETKSCHQFLRNMRSELVRQVVLRDAGDGYELTQDYTFSSPSTAAGVMAGSNINGRKYWKTADGRTLKSVQEERGGA